MSSAEIGTIFRAYILAEHASANGKARSRRHMSRRVALDSTRKLRKILEDCNVVVETPNGTDEILRAVSLSSLAVDPSKPDTYPTRRVRSHG